MFDIKGVTLDIILTLCFVFYKKLVFTDGAAAMPNKKRKRTRQEIAQERKQSKKYWAFYREFY